MEQPTKPDLVSEYETTRNELERAWHNLNTGYGVSLSALSGQSYRHPETIAEQREKILAIVANKADAQERFWRYLSAMDALIANGALTAYNEYTTALYEYHEHKRLVDSYNPETDTLQNAAKAQRKYETLRASKNAKVRRDASPEHRWMLQRLSAATGLDLDRLLLECDAWSKAYRYTISTDTISTR